MAWRGSISRSLISTVRSSTSRLRPPPSPPRRIPFTTPRTIGELGCVQSLLPLHNMVAGVRLTSHLTVNAREFCELSNGTFRRSSQDR